MGVLLRQRPLVPLRSLPLPPMAFSDCIYAFQSAIQFIALNWYVAQKKDALGIKLVHYSLVLNFRLSFLGVTLLWYIVEVSRRIKFIGILSQRLYSLNEADVIGIMQCWCDVKYLNWTWHCSFNWLDLKLCNANIWAGTSKILLFNFRPYHMCLMMGRSNFIIVTVGSLVN